MTDLSYPPTDMRTSPLLVGARGAVAAGFVGVAGAAITIAAMLSYGRLYVAGALSIYVLVGAVVLARLSPYHPHLRFGLANVFTLTRLALISLVGGFTFEVVLANRVPTSSASWFFCAVAGLAIVLDGFDGYAARRQGLSSPFGSRFDMEMDAFLIFILSVAAYAMGKAGIWVLASGLARYAYWAAGWLVPALRTPPPMSWRRKTIAVIQGSVLAAILAPIIVTPLSAVAVAAALAALAYSFAADIVMLTWPTPPTAVAPRWRSWFIALAVLAVALLLPDTPGDLNPRAFLRVPLELPLFLLLPLLLPSKAARVVAAILALVLTVLVGLKIANIIVFEGFGRPFDPLVDPTLVTTALDTLARANASLAGAAILGAVVVVGAVFVSLLWAARSLVPQASVPSRQISAVVAVVLIVGASALSTVAMGDPPRTLSGADTTMLARQQALAFADGLADVGRFKTALAHDPSVARDAGLLAKLKGRDVLLIFVESYGRTAIDTPEQAAIVTPALHDVQAVLDRAGFASRSAWITSPTYGGESWLAHSTFLSGLWVNNQRRYLSLIDSTRSTLVGDFRRAGWRTVGVMPEITMRWPDARYFGFDAFYGAPELAYAGTPFGYMAMPDQFALSAFAKREFAVPGRAPLMAEIALISSHIPWAPIPELVSWDKVGDGRIFSNARTGETAEAVWRTPSRVPAFYAQSIDYVLRTVASFITTYGNENTVAIVLGDHQPVSFISGPSGNHDVPIHIIAKDPAALDALLPGATPGMMPTSASPTWPMDSMRTRLLTAFSTPG